MPTQIHFPFPPQISGISIDNIIKPHGRVLTDEEETFHHDRILSQEVQLLKAQYLLIENDLLTTFDYVYPVTSHLNVFSPKFALIIKNACNLFEIICRRTYSDIYGIGDVNIYNYLALDIFMDFKNIEIECTRLERELPRSACNVFNPFDELQWNKSSYIINSMIPSWWNAYNKIKHNFSDYTNYANLENALRSVFALACLAYKVYGAGVTIGKPLWYQMIGNEKRYYTIDTSVSKLFSNDDGRFFYTLD